MLRHVCALIVVMMAAAATPASAITPAEKMETCKFGADDQKLEGAERKAFLSKCMANEKASPAKSKLPPPSPQ